MQASVRSSLGWMLVAQGCLVVMQFGSSVITARLLNPQEMGVFAVGVAIIGMLGALRTVGLASFLIREPLLAQPTVASTFTINAVLAAATAMVTLLFSHVGANLLQDPGVGRVLSVLALIPLVGALDFLPGALLERTGAFRLLALVNVVRVVIAAVATITLAYWGFSFMSMAWGSLSGAVCGALYLNVVGRSHVSLRVGLHDWRRIARFGTQMLTISLAGNVATRASELVLGRVAGLAALGLYSRASGLNTLLWDNVHLVIARIVFVDFSEHQRRSLSLRESYLRIVAMVTGLLWPAFAGVATISGPLIRSLYGPNWTGAAVPLSMLSLSSAVLVSVTMSGEVYIVCGETRRQVRYELKRTLTGLALFTFGCFGGLVWASLARVGEAACTVWYCHADLKRLTETAVSDYRPIYRQSLLLTILGCLPAAVVLQANDWSPETSFPAVLLAVGLGIALWSVGLWSFGHPLFDEALRLRRRFRRDAIVSPPPAR